MSTQSSLLHLRLKEAVFRSDQYEAINAFNQYQASQCYNPQRIRIYDSHTQRYRYILTACGHCYHCYETKINEWVTRMYAHLEDFKNAYFVTLTYRSICPTISPVDSYNLGLSGQQFHPVERLFLNKLSAAVWHWDRSNSTRHLSYNPCLLVKSHYQNFLKRLRKNTGLNDITYCLCGEYGKNYGRPHFHLILFTNSTLTAKDIRRAWSICLWRDSSGAWSYRRNQKHNGTAYDFPIGRIDFNDLVKNGTLNTTARIKVDNTYMSAAHCFAYVCKYVCKTEKPNLKRVAVAYNNLYISETMYADGGLLGVSPLHIAAAQCEKQYLNIFYNNLKFNSYEEKLPFVSLQIAGDIHFQTTRKVFGQTVLVSNYPDNFTVFCETYLPFVEFSRGTPLGSVYATHHIQEFTQGVFTKPLLQDKGFVVPLYFRAKAQNQLYGLRRMHKTIRGISYNKTPLLDLYRRFDTFLLENVPLRECVPSWETSTDYQQLLQKDTYVFRDLATGEKILLVANRAMFFKYDRHTRMYARTRQIPLHAWISLYMEKLRNDFKHYHATIRDSMQTQRETSYAFANLVMLGLVPSTLRQNFSDMQNEYLHNKQLLYNATHNAIE